jgi:hypothetical protein
MSGQDKVLARARTDSAASDAIVVSFDFTWYQGLKTGAFQAVIRKKIPRSFRPRWLYFHVNSPKSAICARGEIRSVEEIDLLGAIDLRLPLQLEEKEIRGYLGGKGKVGLFRLGEIRLAAAERTSSELRERLVYHPPQSFFRLSQQGKKVIDSMCGF